MNRLKELLETLAAKQKEQDALFEKRKAAALSADEDSRLLSLDTELDALVADIEAAKKSVEIEEKAEKRRAYMTTPVSTLPHPGGTSAGDRERDDPWGEKLSPSLYRSLRSHSVKNFVAREVMLSDGTVKEMSATEQAERFGMWFIATFAKRGRGERAKKYCEQKGIGYEFMSPSLKVAYEGVNESGGLA